MKNYKNSDYAINKYSKGIVYRFADQTVTVTLEDYLKHNPSGTEHEFQLLKQISDADYLDQVRLEHLQNKKNLTIHNLEDIIESDAPPLDEKMIEDLQKTAAAEAFHQLINSGILTETQKRRFLMYIVDGMSLRRIARIEGVYIRAVAQSINAVLETLKKYFNFF